MIRGSRAAEFVLASSPSLRRVWVADTAGPEPSDFGPAGSVVLYSAVDTLEDGPRTEIRMGAVPYAAFRRLTLDPLTLASRPNHLAAWAATWSASAEPDCLPGAFAALYGSDDQPLARIAQSPSEPFAHAVALVPTPIARCGDRVDAIAWSGDRFAAALSGEALGERLVFGSIDSGVPSHDSPTVDEASIRSLTVARLGAGIAAAWVSGPAGNERLRYRLFRMNGSSHGAPHTLGRLDRAPARPVILSASGDALAAMAVTANGPVVLQSQCRLP